MNQRLKRILADGEFLVAKDWEDPSCIQLHNVAGYDSGLGARLKSSTGVWYALSECWPVEAQTELVRIFTKRQALKKSLDDSLVLLQDLIAKIDKGEV